MVPIFLKENMNETDLKNSNEIVDHILHIISSIYACPRMYGSQSSEIDLILRSYHMQWAWITGWDTSHSGKYGRILIEIHGRGHRCNVSFANHFRLHKKNSSKDDSDVLDYVIKMWKKVDKKIGMKVPNLTKEKQDG